MFVLKNEKERVAFISFWEVIKKYRVNNADKSEAERSRKSSSVKG